MTGSEPDTLHALVVDDNEDAASALSLLIEALGHRASKCHSAVEALQCVHEYSPDVVFCDIGMPMIDGYEFARSVRSDTAVVQPYLAAVTAWGGDADRRRSREAGFNSHDTKPLSLEQIERILADAGRWLREGCTPA